MNPPLRGRASFPSCKMLWERQDRCNRASDLQVPEGRSVPAPGSRQRLSCFTKLPRKSCNTNVALLQRKPNPTHHLFYKELLRQQLLVLTCPVLLPPTADSRRREPSWSWPRRDRGTNWVFPHGVRYRPCKLVSGAAGS